MSDGCQFESMQISRREMAWRLDSNIPLISHLSCLDINDSHFSKKKTMSYSKDYSDSEIQAVNLKPEILMTTLWVERVLTCCFAV